MLYFIIIFVIVFFFGFYQFLYIIEIKQLEKVKTKDSKKY